MYIYIKKMNIDSTRKKYIGIQIDRQIWMTGWKVVLFFMCVVKKSKFPKYPAQYLNSCIIKNKPSIFIAWFI